MLNSLVSWKKALQIHEEMLSSNKGMDDFENIFSAFGGAGVKGKSTKKGKQGGVNDMFNFENLMFEMMGGGMDMDFGDFGFGVPGAKPKKKKTKKK